MSDRVSTLGDADAAARAFATDPRHNVVLEASAGTGKTSVLVRRYLNLLAAGVDPANILAITFTRKAAGEMRDRIVDELRAAAARGHRDDVARWMTLRDRLPDIDISTIDAFCYSLLREFPLEADLDPGVTVADETELARLVEEALDHALRISRGLVATNEAVALVFARLPFPRLREGLSHLLARRLVATEALNRYLARGPQGLTAGRVYDLAMDELRALFSGLSVFSSTGPIRQPRFQLLVEGLEQLASGELRDPGDARAVLDELRRYFLTQEGEPRRRPRYAIRDHATEAAYRAHAPAIADLGPRVKGVLERVDRGLNVILARGIRQIYQVALAEYRRTLAAHDVVDFAEVLERAVSLLERMDEFAQSRFRLESRYHHVLVDEFQDTSRMQWTLVSLLIRSWGEGVGVAQDAPLDPSLFVVGDRKQSIYRFRDAEVRLIDEAADDIERLRPGESVRRWISRSFRARPALLSFANDLFAAIDDGSAEAGRFRYGIEDRFPIDTVDDAMEPALGLAVGRSAEASAAAVAAEIAEIIGRATVRDRESGVPRTARAGDVAILFRSRESHREFERALAVRGIPSYVYKGLGFYDADEIKDLVALVRYLAAPESSLRAAAFLRSGFVRISDRALRLLSPDVAGALVSSTPPAARDALDDEDRRVLDAVREAVGRWLAQVDRVPPAELMDQVLVESAYAFEWRGPRRRQARENVKKMRGLVRRIQNRGYATLGRVADHIDRLSAGDESNAVVDAEDSVQLMTVHAAKGLEFPIVFVVNLARGAGGVPPPVKLVVDGGDGEPLVTVATRESDLEDLEARRNREETKRLLYVAVTRARDRLYLGTVLEESGAFAPGSGSLGDVLPPKVRTLLESAGVAATSTVEWVGPEAAHVFRVCPLPASKSDAEALPRTTLQVADSVPASLDRLDAGLVTPDEAADLADLPYLRLKS
jgi:ATP-dependent helicase/nuclease subunit A